MIDKVELCWLLSFQAVYEQLSFRKAAEQLQLPSSNVSRHVALLEQQLNLRLLERTTRRMRPTAAGTQLYQSLQPLTRALDDALEEVAHQGDTLAGHLKIIMPDLPPLATLIADFCALHPRIELSCDTQLDPDRGLLDGYDLVIRFGRGPLEDSGWVARELLRWPSVVVAAPSLLQRHPAPRTLTELSQAPCITTLSVLQGQPWRFQQQRPLSVTASYRVNSGQLARAAALNGLGFALLPLHSCEADIERGVLVPIRLDATPEDLVLYAFHAGRKYPLQKVRALLDHLQAGLAAMEQPPG